MRLCRRRPAQQRSDQHRAKRARAAFAVVAMLLAAGATARAQVPSAHELTKSARVARTSATLTVDGVLGEAAWTTAPVVSDFVQQEPNVNEPATESTDVRVLADDTAFYFGITCTQASGVIARERRRDNPLADDDRFEIVLDTFHDHRNAYHFAINPLGTQYDALVTDEGHDVNVDWDERWWSETQITATGWTAEIRIPFNALRSAATLDAFGVNFLRFTRGTNETRAVDRVGPRLPVPAGLAGRSPHRRARHSDRPQAANQALRAWRSAPRCGHGRRCATRCRTSASRS